MTIEDWSKKNGISKNKDYYWNYRIRENQKLDKEVTFDEITPISSNTDDVVLNSAKPADFQLFFKNIQVLFQPISIRLLWQG